LAAFGDTGLSNQDRLRSALLLDGHAFYVGSLVRKLDESASQPATAGTVNYEGTELTRLSRKSMQRQRSELQIVFQDPYASLDPRLPVNEIVAEPLRIHGRYGSSGAGSGRDQVRELLRLVGLKPEHGNRFPHEFSGGQRQRIGIARALALRPKVLILDEPVSALDVSIQAGVLNLLEDLQAELGLSYLFVSHDLSVVRHVADRIAVMYLGRIVETATAEELFATPAHPYTQALISAIPLPDPRKERARQRIILSGDVPSPANPPSGCRFRTRCPLFAAQLTDAQRQRCSTEIPLLVDHGHGHPAACHFADLPSASASSGLSVAIDNGSPRSARSMREPGVSSP
ncbi:MAG TPA: oligopeptide/dipeptide ABC transporter ATP-binding protein, partial [Pseudonocardiaceae bacterium]|nr:oligopeptide/dipeptide ABC transporter ATP-binding protein [Pseudonocardiaceae bacterium]